MYASIAKVSGKPLPYKLTEPIDEAAVEDKPDAVRATTEKFLSGVTSALNAAWKFDLLQLSPKVGDIVEMKLVVVDRLGQTGESEIVELLVSAATIALAATPGEELRQRVATELEHFDQALKPLELKVRALAKSAEGKDKPKEAKAAEAKEPELSDAERREAMVAASKAISAEVDRQVPELLKLVEQAESQADNNISLLELEQTGAALVNLKHKTTPELNAIVEKNRQLVPELDKKAIEQNKKQTQEIAQRVQQVEHASHLLAERFRTMVSHDVQKRLAQQATQLEQLYNNFGSSETEPDVQQNRRELIVLSRQLKEFQQSMLDALPSVRQETKQRLRAAADAAKSSYQSDR